MVYKFRSDRGPVHISPEYTANEMDSILMLHAGKWMFAELLRIAWNKDRKVIAETIADIIQLEHSLIHELDGTPLILDHTVSAPEEILLLLNHADGHKLQKDKLTKLAKNNTESSVASAISRLTKSNEIRANGVPGGLALTPKGQKRVIKKSFRSSRNKPDHIIPLDSHAARHYIHRCNRQQSDMVWLSEFRFWEDSGSDWHRARVTCGLLLPTSRLNLATACCQIQSATGINSRRIASQIERWV